ncbi:kinase-like domain-containing protein [Rhizophagus clarus]|uniref:Kinase-like domain-containing protein n=1 Tax=Rhizophagus clarus TaxID=94130 RepID=A0A8H3LVH8_9GLOM|nr:kinase-like domain-containing protein [Rhizophagus clarus]
MDFGDQSRSLHSSSDWEIILNIKSQLYGNCSDCKQQRIAAAWCKTCDIAILKENFCNWTSGNPVKNINKRGAFSSIYSAIWMEGPRWNLDEEAEVWNRNGPINVILKRLDNSHVMSQEFINQLRKYHKCLQSGALADCFGITKDPTSCYMFVLRYYKNGNLYSFLEESMGILSWRDIIDILWSISAGLNVIHELGLVHGHLHGGNILVENEMDSVDAKIADTGLHGPVDKSASSQQIYGVIPFVAPEIFNENLPTKESDIYSFGMIMWMMSAAARPYYDKPHDQQLIQEIYAGLRPNVVNGTPPVYSRLMLQCLDGNPSNRPTASQLYECFGNWISEICDNPDPSDLSNQFDAAEEIKFSNFENLDFNISQCHEKAIYFSRPLRFLNSDPFLYSNNNLSFLKKCKKINLLVNYTNL